MKNEYEQLRKQILKEAGEEIEQIKQILKEGNVSKESIENCGDDYDKLMELLLECIGL